MDHTYDITAAVYKKADVNSSKNMMPPDVSEDVQEMASFANLALGFDSKEDWEEELREAPPDNKNELASPTIPCKKPVEGFTLTPRLSRYEASQSESPKIEAGDLQMDLTTPHQSVCLHLDCPGRPAKGRKTSHTPAERSSCRHLFSHGSNESIPIVSTSTIGEACRQDSEQSHHTHSPKIQRVTEDSSECSPAISIKMEDLMEDCHQVLEDKPLLNQGEEKPIQNMGFVYMHESGMLSTPEEGELPTPIGSPHSDSSVCSSCELSLSSSGSPLSSPILSQVKLMSQTIESDASDEECENAVIVGTVVDPPEPGSSAVDDIKDYLDHGIESQFQSKISSEMKELNLDTVTDVRPEVKPGSTLVSDVVPVNAEEAFDIKELHCEVIPLARKRRSSNDKNSKAAKPEVNLTISSVGSTSSNWTAVSGVSPLPASDPTHLHHRHRHRHHHHHHHHHHARHHYHNGRHSHTHSLSRNGDFLLTSTPVHKKLVTERVNVSSVTSTPDTEFSAMLFPKESRFVLSTELQFTDSSIHSQVSLSEAEAPGDQEGPSPPLESALCGSNKKDIELCSSQKTHLSVIQSSREMKKVTTDADDNDNPGETCQTRKRSIGATRTDSEKDRSEKEEDMHRPQKKMYAKVISGNELVKSGVISITKPIILHHKEDEDTRNASWIRQLTKKEAEVLLATPANITDDIWDQLPSPRRASSVDESLFRSVSSDSHLSVTLE